MKTTQLNKAKFQWIILLTLMLAGMSTLVGCNNEAYEDGELETTTPTFFPSNSGNNNNNNGGANDPDVEDFPADAPTFSFDVTGINGSKPVYSTLENSGLFYTDSILRVKIDAGPGVQGSAGGFVATYDCVTYKVTARRWNTDTAQDDGLNWPQTTDVLAAEQFTECAHPLSGEVYTSNHSDVVNFDMLTNFGSPYPYYFQVSHVRTNWRCMMYTLGILEFQSACTGNGLYSLYENHNASGEISVWVNGLTP